MTKAEWEAKHGVAGKGIVGSSYENGKYDVAFTDDGYVNMIWVYYKNGGVDLETARFESRTLLPADATPLGASQTLPDEGGDLTTYVDTYKSPSIIPIYKPVMIGNLSIDPWNEGEPGTLNVIFKHFKSEGGVGNFLVDVGKFERP